MLRFLSLAAICLGLVGCQAFNKKPQGQANGAGAPSAAVPPRLGKPNNLPPANSNNKQSGTPVLPSVRTAFWRARSLTATIGRRRPPTSKSLLLLRRPIRPARRSPAKWK